MSVECREAQRDAFCRSCDLVIERGEKMISMYSHRNRGQWIHFCLYCAVIIGEMATDAIEQKPKVLQ